MVSSTDFVRASERTTAIATLNRQRHLTPSCGGFTPTAERTVGPARMIVESLTARPGIRERPCRDDGDGEFVRFCASARKGDRDCNIEPPASPYAIMRRVHPYRGENSGPGKDIVGELDTQTRN